MVLYRRNKVEGATYFFTVTLVNRRSNALVKNIDVLRSGFQKVQHTYPFITDAIVIMPDHIHAIWTLPDDDKDYSLRWRLIKRYFSHDLISNNKAQLQNSRGESNIWQRRFWEHTIHDSDDLQHHIDYIHYNPVKHGLVETVDQWPYSSFHKYVNSGVLPKNWGDGFSEHSNCMYGE